MSKSKDGKGKNLLNLTMEKAMKKTISLMMNFIKSVIIGTSFDGTLLNNISEEELKKLYKLSKSHDMAHLIGSVVSKNIQIKESEELKIFRNETYMAVYRYEQLHYEYESICALFDEKGIPYIPLKGAIIRQYYPEPWLRTSCDIDILIQERDLDNAKNAVVAQLGYRFVSRGRHDCSFFSPSGIHFELHYTLIEDDVMQRIEKPLKNVWEYAVLAKDHAFKYMLKDEMFYYYHVAHMAKHYVQGGCGIRPFLDIWVINHKTSFDTERREELLKEGGLLQFAHQAELLSDIWFGEKKHTALTVQMEDYLMGAGVYGNLSNRVVAFQIKEGGKTKYLFSRIWLPYENLRFYYPELEKRKWLLPWYQVKRWCRIILLGNKKRVIKEMQINKAISEEQKRRIADLFEGLGLDLV